jgi:hypothetical protein
MTIEITCTKANPEQRITIPNCDSNMKVSAFRNLLVSKNFIAREEDREQWRFVLSNVESVAGSKPAYTDRMLGLGSEVYAPISDVMLENSKNEIVITNILTSVKPDLIGFASNWFAGGKLKVRCTLSDNPKNKDKFQPVMLTDVITTNPNQSIYYSNVCICCEDSALYFGLRCFGSVGFEYRASLASGDLMRQSATHWAPGTYEVYGEHGFKSWQDDDKAIIMKAIENVSGIDPQTKMNYMKATLIAKDMEAWRDWGAKPEKIYSIDDKPKLQFSRIQPMELSMKTAAQKQQQQQIVPGSDITPSTPVKGDKEYVNYGKWWPERSKPWEKPEGTLDIYFFTFKTLEAAKKHFDRYNTTPLHEHGNIWGI